MAYNFDDLDDVLADEDSDDEEEEAEQSNGYFEDLDAVLDEDGSLVEPNTDETDDESEPLTRSKRNGDCMDCGSIGDNEIANNGVDHGYGRDWFDHDNDDDGTVNDDSTRSGAELEQSDGGLSNSESIEETDLLSAGGGSSEYESSGCADNMTILLDDTG